MHHVPLTYDLSTAATQRAEPLEQITIPTDPEIGASALIDFAKRANFGLFESLAMLLKHDWEVADRSSKQSPPTCVHANAMPTKAAGPQAALLGGAPMRWEPWQDAAAYVALLAAFEDCPAQDRMTVLLLEQCALGCHHLAAQRVTKLAQRHARSTALLDEAAPHTQQSFTDDKREWLLHEFELTHLIDMRRQLVDEMLGARFAFLSIMADAYTLMVEAGHRLAQWRYREHFGDLTMTAQEVSVRLALHLGACTGKPADVGLEPELLAALQDSVEEVASDHRVMREISALFARGATEPASEEHLREATTLFRKLARIHPDALSQHPEYPSISSENQRRLAQIWVSASATHRARVHLDRRMLLNYLDNLKAWLSEVERILRHLSFHDPSKLVEGDTLAEQWAFVQAALAEVQRQLHATRGDLAQLQLDPRHEQHQRVVRLNEAERKAERSSMAARAQAWNTEALAIEARMLARCAAEAIADAFQLKGHRT